jgi:hypothetical protein
MKVTMPTHIVCAAACNGVFAFSGCQTASQTTASTGATQPAAKPAAAEATPKPKSAKASKYVFNYPPPPQRFGSGLGSSSDPDADLLQTVTPHDSLAPDPIREQQLRRYGAPTVNAWRAGKALMALRAKLKD